MSRQFHFQCSRAMSLVEVVLALGIVSFVLISMLGLMPVMLGTLRESRQNVVAQRIYQTVALHLRESLQASQQDRTYEFDEEGFLLRISGGPDDDPVDFPFSKGEKRYTAQAKADGASLPGGSSANAHLIISHIKISNTVTDAVVWERSIGICQP